MSNQIAQENQAGKSDSTESSQNRSKNFEVPLGYVEYRNIQERVELDEDNDEGLRIKNYLCHQSQNKFIKVTQIRWKNQTLKITDEYCINQKFSKRGQIENQPKVFHSKRFNYSQPNNSEKKDTKNLIKNIINLFSKWLRIAKPPQFETLAEQLKQIIDKNIYYNKILINEISQQRDISEAFIVFCANDGEDMVQHSRINDKKCHIKAIKNYQKYFEEKVKTIKEPEGEGILAKVESF